MDKGQSALSRWAPSVEICRLTIKLRLKVACLQIIWLASSLSTLKWVETMESQELQLPMALVKLPPDRFLASLRAQLVVR